MRPTAAALLTVCLLLAACGGSAETSESTATAAADGGQGADQQADLAACMSEQGYDLPDFGGGAGGDGGGGGPRGGAPSEFPGRPDSSEFPVAGGPGGPGGMPSEFPAGAGPGGPGGGGFGGSDDFQRVETGASEQPDAGGRPDAAGSEAPGRGGFDDGLREALQTCRDELGIEGGQGFGGGPPSGDTGDTGDAGSGDS